MVGRRTEAATDSEKLRICLDADGLLISDGGLSVAGAAFLGEIDRLQREVGERRFEVRWLSQWPEIVSERVNSALPMRPGPPFAAVGADWPRGNGPDLCIGTNMPAALRAGTEKWIVGPDSPEFQDPGDVLRRLRERLRLAIPRPPAPQAIEGGLVRLAGRADRKAMLAIAYRDPAADWSRTAESTYVFVPDPDLEDELVEVGGADRLSYRVTKDAVSLDAQGNLATGLASGRNNARSSLKWERD